MGARGGKKKSAKRGRNKNSAQVAKSEVIFTRVAIDDRLGSDERFWATVIGKYRPRAVDAEPKVDVAIFDDVALEQCEQPIQEEVRAVRAALSFLASGQDDAARERVAGISRRSELSEWRLLVRFLTDWYADQFDAARTVFEKLTEGRRPWKIARNLLSASDQHRLDQPAVDRYLSVPKGEMPRQAMIEGVRRLRFERPAIVELQRLLGLVNAGTSPDILAQEGPPTINDKTSRLIESFCQRYRGLEKELVDAVMSNARRSLRNQDDSRVFERFVSRTPGPFFDVNHNLLRHLHYHTFADSLEDSGRALKTYIDEIKVNDWVSEDLRNALTSLLYLRVAKQAQYYQQQASGRSIYAMFDRSTADYEMHADLQEVIFDSLTAACDCWPENRVAQEMRVRMFEEELELADSVSDVKAVNRHLCEANSDFAKAFPNEVKPRLWLVDYHLENDQPEAAEPYARQLADARVSNLRVLLVPWKQVLIGAMNAARKKTSLERSAELLEQADRLWPTWIGKDWLGYLKAALQIRMGDPAGNVFAESLDTLAHRLAMLAAAQRMHVPAKELKVYREQVLQAVNGTANPPLSQLVETAVFLRQLSKAGITYSAYRSHAGRIEKQLLQGFAKKTWKTLVDMGEPFRETLYWLAERGVFDYSKRASFAKRVGANASSWLKGVLVTITYQRQKPSYVGDEYEDQLNELELHLAKENDQYLRMWYAELLEFGRATLENYKESASFRFGSSIGRSLERMARAIARSEQVDFDDPEFDEDEEDDYDFDRGSQCNCPSCVAARRKQAASGASSFGDSSWFSNRDDDDDDYADVGNSWSDGVDGFESPKLSSPRTLPDPRVGEEIKRTRPKQPLGKKNKKSKK